MHYSRNPHTLYASAPEQVGGIVRTGSRVMQIAEPDEFDFASPEEAARINDPRRMTRSQLRCLGVPRLVYLRCGTVGGEPAFALHAADGTQIAVVDDMDLAMELAFEHNMTFVAVH